jgi:hypothetical protein
MTNFWSQRDKYLKSLSKTNKVINRLLIAGKGREHWPRNVGDFFYRNYLKAEAEIMFKELAGKRRFTREKRYQIDKKGRRKYPHLFGNYVCVSSKTYDTLNNL